MYVTWVDSPTDGLVADSDDEADGNGDGVDDSGGKDMKRTTVVVTWPDPLGAGDIRRLTMGSLFHGRRILIRAQRRRRTSLPWLGARRIQPRVWTSLRRDGV